MKRIELYTPWRESPEALVARTVGRDALLTRLHQAAADLAANKRPVPLFFFGARGVGKSHLLALAVAELKRRGLGCVVVSEDIPAINVAEDLLRRGQASGQPTWARWGQLPPVESGESPVVWVIEGLDRRLHELGTPVERQRLRAAWSGAGAPWILASGVEIPPELAEQQEPFYGFFDPIHVSALDDSEAAALIDRVVPPETRARAGWTASRDTLVTLGAGAPRVLVSLAEGCGDDAGVGDALLTVVEHFTPHFQMRFRDLSGQSQQIVDLLAVAPRELTPADIAKWLAISQPVAGKQSRRLADEGVLLRREGDGHTWYRIAEPLFRFWLEYRNSVWQETRVAMATDLLFALYAPEQIVALWWSAGALAVDDPLRHAVGERARRRAPEVDQRAKERVMEEVDRWAIGGGEEGTPLQGVLQKAEEAGCLVSALRKYPTRLALLDGAVARVAEPALRATVEFALAVLRDSRPRPAFDAWLPAAVEARQAKEPVDWFAVSHILFSALDATSGPGKPWRLGERRRDVAALPVLRARFLLRGRLEGHDPVLDADVLAAVALDERDPDLGLLLAAGVRRGAPDLVERVLTVRTARSPGALPVCPVPERACPRRAEAMVRWMIAALPTQPIAALSWARTLAVADEASWTAWSAALRGLTYAEVPRHGRTQAETALAALAVASPERATALADGVAAPMGPWMARALAFGRLLGELEPGRLHPELERLAIRYRGVS